MLEGKVVNLRPIKKEDLKYIQIWINDLEVQYYSQENYPVYFNPAVVKYIYDDGIKGKRYIFIMEDKSGEVVGEIWLYPIDFSRKIAELVIIIGKKDVRGKGYGRDAINIIKEYAFKNIGLNSIYLKVFSFNTRAIKCYMACGFTVVERNNRKVIRFGVKYDELIMQLKKDAH